MNRCCLVAMLCLALLASVALAAEPAVKQVDGDRIVLQNAFLKAVIAPKQGGAIVSLTDPRDGIERLDAPSMVDANLLPGGRVQSLGDLAFVPAGMAVSAGPGTEQCSFSAMLPPKPAFTEDQLNRELSGNPWALIVTNPDAIFETPPYEKVRLTKTYVLGPDSRRLDIGYKLENTGDRPVEVSLGTTVALKGRTPRRRLATAHFEGALILDAPMDRKAAGSIWPLGKRQTGWLYHLPAAWVAAVDAEGNGAAAWFTPEHASFLKVMAGTGKVEVGRNRLTLPPGGHIGTTAQLIVLQGMKNVHGVTQALVTGVSVSPESADGTLPLGAETIYDTSGREQSTALATDADAAPKDLLRDIAAGEAGQYEGGPIRLKMSLLSARDMQPKATLSIRRNPNGEWSVLGAKTITLTAGTPFELPMSVQPKRKGTHIVRVTLEEGGREVAQYDHPVVAGKRSGFFTPAGPAKVGAVNDDFLYRNTKRAGFPIRGDWEPSTRVYTAHVTTAKPLAGGPLRVLAISPYWGAREIVQLAQRVDAEIDTVVSGKCGYRDKFVLYYGATMQNAPFDEVDRLRLLLSKPHDVIVMYNTYGDWFPSSIMQEIARQVEQDGVGLVAVQPDNVAGPLETLSKRASEPTGFFTDTRARVGTFGRGRVAFFDGAARSATALVGSESSYQDVARMALWAGRGEPAVVVKAADVPANASRKQLAAEPLTFEVTNRGRAAFEGTLRVVPRRDLVRMGRFYGDLPHDYRFYPVYEDACAPIDVPISLPAGRKQTVAVKLPALAGAPYSIDAGVLDAASATVTSIRRPMRVTAEVTLPEITVGTRDEDRVTFAAHGQKPILAVRPRATLRVECLVKGPGGEGRVVMTGSDPYGRTLFRREAEVSWTPQGVRVGMQAPLKAAVHRILILRFRVVSGEEELVERRERIITFARPEHIAPFELRGYTDIKINPRESAYDTRVGGGGEAALAWIPVRQTEYGGWLPGGKIIAPGDKEKQAPTDPTKLLGEGLELKDADLADEVADLVAEKPKREDFLKAGWIRVPCFLDPEWREPTIDGVVDRYKSKSAFGPYRGFAVDEFFYYKEEVGKDEWRRSFIPGRDTNICRCEHCRAGFIAFARERFGGDLAALNAAWSTDFETWEAVDTPVIDPNTKTGPAEPAWPHILAHRQFIDTQVPGVLAETRERIKKIHPGCQTGMSGMWTTGLWVGLDIFHLAQHCEFNMLYRDVDIWESFGGAGGVNWRGYSAKYNPIRESSAIWTNLFQGNVASGYYGKHITPMWRADHTFHKGPQALFDTVREIREKGYDRLLVGHRKVDPIAIYYDPASIYIAGLEEWKEDQGRFVGHWRNAGRSHMEFPLQVGADYRNLLRGSHLQPFWAGYGHLEEGHFGRFGTPKLMLLPYATVLSANQAQTLRAFVRNGGVLVGDVQVGMRDRHGVRREAGILDDVFGVKRSGDYAMRYRGRQETVKDDKGEERTTTAPVRVRFGEAFGEPFTMAFDAVDPMALSLTTGRALAQYDIEGQARPAFVVNEFGKGKAILLNVVPSGYTVTEAGGVAGEETTVAELKGLAAERYRRVFEKVLEVAGIAAPVRYEGSASVYRFGDGAHDYVCLRTSYRNAWKDEVLGELTLREKAHVYDVRRGEYLGLRRKVATRFDPRHMIADLVIAALPYKVEGVDVSLNAEAIARGGTLHIEASVRPATTERHVFAARLTRPDGTSPRWYRTSFETDDGIGRGRFDLAESDPTGTWTLTVTDVVSGTSKDLAFTVSETP